MRPEYFLVYLSLAWLSGVAFARYVSAPSWLWLALAGLAGASLFLWRRFPRLPPIAICVVAFGLGAARYQAAQPPFGDPAFVATYNGQGQVRLAGVVVDEPDVRDDHVNLRLRVEQLTTLDDGATRGVGGLALVQTPRFPVYGYGDRLRVTGALETPPVFEDFSYRDHLARQGVHSLLRRGLVRQTGERACLGEWSAACNPLLQAVFDFKVRALQTVAAVFPEPQAALLSGILLGVDAGIPAGVQAAFNATGTTHIIAISGQM